MQGHMLIFTTEQEFEWRTAFWLLLAPETQLYSINAYLSGWLLETHHHPELQSHAASCKSDPKPQCAIIDQLGKDHGSVPDHILCRLESPAISSQRLSGGGNGKGFLLRFQRITAIQSRHPRPGWSNRVTQNKAGSCGYESQWDSHIYITLHRKGLQSISKILSSVGRTGPTEWLPPSIPFQAPQICTPKDWGIPLESWGLCWRGSSVREGNHRKLSALLEWAKTLLCISTAQDPAQYLVMAIDDVIHMFDYWMKRTIFLKSLCKVNPVAENIIWMDLYMYSLSREINRLEFCSVLWLTRNTKEKEGILHAFLVS